MNKIKDFGEKIGGARKDVWAARGLMLDDLMSMNSMERSKYAKKAYVWPVPNWEQLLADGKDQALLYWQNEMRKAFPATPQIRISQRNNEEALSAAQEAYVSFCAEYRAAVMSVSDLHQIGSFCQDFLVGNGYLVENKYGAYRYSATDKAANCVSNKMVALAKITNVVSLKSTAAAKLFAISKDDKAYVATKNRYQAFRHDGKAVSISPDYHEKGIQVIVNSGFSKIYFYDHKVVEAENTAIGTFFVFDIKMHSIAAYCKTKEEAEAFIETMAQKAKEEDAKADEDTGKKSSRKKSFSFKKLERIQRTIPSHLASNAGEKEFLEDLRFRACEFGNWVGDNERQLHLDLAYNSLADLADILGVEHQDISLNGTLALAFGSRGRGGSGAASAHYEPMRQVINLTKMNGAGCLAHEWAHGFDHYIAHKLGVSSSGYLSEALFARGNTYANMVPKAYCELVKLFTERCTPVSDEEAEEKKKRIVEQYALGLRNICNTHFPKRSSSEEERAAWKSCLAQMIDAVGEYQEHELFQPLQDLANLLPARVRRGFINEMLPRIERFKAVLDTPISNYKDTRGMSSDFFTGSKEFDKKYSKAGQGYWASIVEMFARAFDCYVEDKLKMNGQYSDYLSSHASSYYTFIAEEKGGKIDARICYAYPVGEERKAINEKFDELFEQVKEMGIFHRAEVQTPKNQPVEENTDTIPVCVQEEPLSQPDEQQIQTPLSDTDQHSAAETLFLNCGAIVTVMPRTMSDTQKREWEAAVLQVFADPSQENVSALSTLRTKIVGRSIPSYNLRKITAAVFSAKGDKPVTAPIMDQKAGSVSAANVMPAIHQISFDELMGVAK